jgi:hypothetical protein
MSGNSKGEPNAKNQPGEFERFTNFMRRLVAVPHSEIKAAMEAERKSKISSSVSRDSASSSRER